MLSRLRQSSAKQHPPQQAPPRPLQQQGFEDPSMFQFRHLTPGLDRQQGPSPSQKRNFRPQSSTEHDRDPQSFVDRTRIGPPDRSQPFVSDESHSFSMSGSDLRAERDENDRQWQLSGARQDIGAPPPMRFRPDLPRPPRPPRMLQPRGMGPPPSLLALDIERPPSMPSPSQKDFNKSLIFQHDEQNDPSRDEEIQNLRPPAHVKQANDGPPLQLEQNVQRPPLQTEGSRPSSLQDRLRRLAEEPLRPPPSLPEGFRPPLLPSARPPSFPQNVRMPHINEDSQSLQQQSIPQWLLLPSQNFPRPPSFLKDHVSETMSAKEDQPLSQGQMLQGPPSLLGNQTENYPRLPTLVDVQHPLYREMPSNDHDIYSDGSSHEEMRRPPAPPLKAAPPSLMEMNIQRPPVRPPMPPLSSHEPLPSGRGTPDPNATPGSQQPLAAQQGLMRGPAPPPGSARHGTPASFQVGMSNEPLAFTGRMPPHSVDGSFPRNPPPRLPNSGVRLPPFPPTTTPPPSVSNQTSGAGSCPVGMSDEPLQFTGRMPAPHVRFPPYSQQQQNVPASNVRPPSASTQSTEDGSNYPVGMSDEPLQFTGRMPAPRIQGPSYPRQQHLPNSSIRPMAAPQSAGDGQQAQGVDNRLVGQSDEPLQFAGRMPLPRMQGPSYPQQQNLPSIGISPLAAPQLAGDGQQTQGVNSRHVGQSDVPLQFTGRMPAPPIQGPSYPQQQRLPSSGVRPMAAPQLTGDGQQTQGVNSRHVGQSDIPLQFTGRMPAPPIQGPYPQQQHLPSSGVRPMAALQLTGDSQQTQGVSSHLVGQSDEPLQFAGRMPAPHIQGPSAYQQPQNLPNSGEHGFSSSPALNSAAVSTPGQTLLPPVCLPPLGMQPPFIRMPPPRPLPPPPVGSGPHMGMPVPDGVTARGARMPPPFPGGTVLPHSVDGSIPLPGAPVANTVLPPPALRPPFQSPAPNLVSCCSISDVKCRNCSMTCINA